MLRNTVILDETTKLPEIRSLKGVEEAPLRKFRLMRGTWAQNLESGFEEKILTKKPACQEAHNRKVPGRTKP